VAWIESHQSLRDHPKTNKLIRRLSCSRAEAVGYLHMLWWWALEYAQDGDLSRFDGEEIAVAADYPGDGELFVAALTAAGFLTAEKRIHDWDDFGGKYLKRREQSRVRQQRFRDSHGRYVSPDDDATPDVTNGAVTRDAHGVTRYSRVSNTVRGQERTGQDSNYPPTPLPVVTTQPPKPSRNGTCVFAEAIGGEKFGQIASHFAEVNVQLDASWLRQTLARCESGQPLDPEAVRRALRVALPKLEDAFSRPNQIGHPAAFAARQIEAAWADERRKVST
jgi:hypothetical protein